MERTEHSFVAPSGLSLAVHDWGGGGDPVLLSHPTGFHGVAWQPVAERLVARGRRVWSFDLPMRSRYFTGPFSWEMSQVSRTVVPPPAAGSSS